MFMNIVNKIAIINQSIRAHPYISILNYTVVLCLSLSLKYEISVNRRKNDFIAFLKSF